VVIVAPSRLPAVERFKDYLPTILASPRPVDLFVYTPGPIDPRRPARITPEEEVPMKRKAHCREATPVAHESE